MTTIVNKTAAFTIADADLDTNSESVTYVCTGTFAITIPATGVTTGGEFTIKSTDGLQTFTTTGATVTPPLYMSVELYGDEASVGITCLATGDYSIVGDLASTVSALEGVVAFKASLQTVHQNITTTGVHIIELNTADFDTNQGFDTTNHYYEVPITGTYHFDWSARIGDLSATESASAFFLGLSTNGTSILDAPITGNGFSTNDETMGGSTLLELEAGDKVYLCVRSDYATPTYEINRWFTSLAGHLISPTTVLAKHGVDHYFSVHKDGSDQNITTTAITPVTWSTADSLGTQNVAFDFTNNQFVAPVSGLYYLYATCQLSSNSAATILHITTTGEIVQRHADRESSTSGFQSYSAGGTFYLKAGETAKVEITSSDANYNVRGPAITSYFGGYLVSGSNTGIEYDSYDVAFNVMPGAGAANQTITTADTYEKVDTAFGDTPRVDRGGNWDATNKRFIAPVDGIYSFTGYIYVNGLTAGDRVAIAVYKNGAVEATLDGEYDCVSNAMVTGGTEIYLKEGEYAELWWINTSAGAKIPSTETNTVARFSGYLIRSTTKAECSFRAYLSANDTGFVADADNVVELDSVTYDYGGNFDTSTFKFTAPEDGRYQFNGQVRSSTMLVTESCIPSLYVNGSAVAYGGYNPSEGTGQQSNSVNDILDLTKGDYVELRAYHTGGTPETLQGSADGSRTYFSGYRLVTSQDTPKITSDLSDVSSSAPNGSDILSYNAVTEVYEPTQVLQDEVSFKAILSSDQTLTNNTWTQIQFASEEYDNGDNFDTSTYEFTAPVAGTYVFNASLGSADNLPADTESRVRISVNSSVKATSQRTQYGTAETYTKVAVDLNIKLSAGDVVSVETRQISGGDMDALAAASYTQFSGHLLTPPVTLAPHGVDHSFSVSNEGGTQDDIPLSTWTNVAFGVAESQKNMSFDFTGNDVLIPSSGTYQFSAVVTLEIAAAAYKNLYLCIAVNGTQGQRLEHLVTNSTRTSYKLQANTSLELNAGDVVALQIHQDVGATGTDILTSKNHTYFSGVKASGSHSGIEYDSYDVAFNVFLSTDSGTLTVVTWTNPDYDTVEFDNGGNWDSVNKYFIAPMDGIYNFQAHALIEGLTDGNDVYATLYVNGVIDKRLQASRYAGESEGVGGSVTKQLTAGDTVEIRVYTNSTVANIGGEATGYHTWFSGYLLKTTTKAECSFRAYLSANQTNVVADVHDPIDLNAVQYDKGGNFDTTTHKFTAPDDGRYFFSGRVRCDTMLVHEQLAATLMVNGVVTAQGTASEAQSTGSMSSIVVDVLTLEKDDLVNLCAYHSGVTPETIVGDASATTTYLTGHRMISTQDVTKDITDLTGVSTTPAVINDVLMNDGNEYVPTQVFQDEVSFSARYTTTTDDVSFTTDDPIVCKFSTINYNVGGAYDYSTSTFTAPVEGRYRFRATVLLDAGGADQSRIDFKFHKNGVGTSNADTIASTSGSSYQTISGDVLLSLSEGDEIQAVILNKDGVTYGPYDGTGAYSKFEGYLISPSVTLAPHGVDHYFSVHKDGSDQNITTTAITPVTWSTADSLGTQNVAFDFTNNQFVAPVSGLYYLYATCQLSSNSAATILHITTTGEIANRHADREPSVSGFQSFSAGGTFYLKAGETAKVEITSSDANYNVRGPATTSYFGGYLVSGSNTGIEYDSYDIAFRSYLSVDSSVITAATWTDIVFDSIHFDNGKNFDTSTGHFIAPVTGVYHINAGANFQGVVAGERLYLQASQVGSVNTSARLGFDFDSFTTTYITGGATFQMEAGDYLEIRVYVEGATTFLDAGSSSDTWVSGHLVQATTKAECSFNVNLNNVDDTTTINAPSWFTVPLSNIEFNNGNCYDATTNHRFDVPEDGRYLFNWQVTLKTLTSTATDFFTRLYKNNVDIPAYGSRPTPKTAQPNHSNGGIVLDLVAGDYIELQVYQNESTSETIHGAPANTFFSGYRLVTTPTTNAYSPVVWETTIDTATDTVDVPSGLLGGTDYRVELAWVDPTTSASICSLYINDDTTASNYARTHQFASGATPQSGEAADALLAATNTTADHTAVSKGTITVIDGNYHGRFQYSRPVSGAMVGDIAVVNTTTTMNTITDIQFKSSVAASFGVGTRVRILKD